jgi:transposase-like protein
MRNNHTCGDDMNNVVKMPTNKPSVLLCCSACGAEARASCNCGAPYIPAGARAAEAIAKNPEKSDRAIAAEIGVSDTTVLRARKAGASHEATDRRTGKDGKSYKASKPKKSAVTAEDRSNLAAEVLYKGKTLAETAKKAGVSVQIIKTAIAREEGRRDAGMISIQTVIEMLDPLFEEASNIAKTTNNNTLSSNGLLLKNVLMDITNRGRKLLNEWASGNETVRLTPGLKKDKARRDRARAF